MDLVLSSNNVFTIISIGFGNSLVLCMPAWTIVTDLSIVIVVNINIKNTRQVRVSSVNLTYIVLLQVYRTLLTAIFHTYY